VSGFLAIGTARAFEVELLVVGVSHALRAGSVVVANGAPPASLLAQGRGRPDPFDGWLDVTAILEVGSRRQGIENFRLENGGWGCRVGG